jgi:hypothetical protein
MQNWSKREDKRLQKLTECSFTSWAQIASFFPKRTPGKCKKRAKELKLNFGKNNGVKLSSLRVFEDPPPEREGREEAFLGGLDDHILGEYVEEREDREEKRVEVVDLEQEGCEEEKDLVAVEMISDALKGKFGQGGRENLEVESEWSQEDEQLLVGLFGKFGKKWDKYVVVFDGKGKVAIKSKFMSLVKDFQNWYGNVTKSGFEIKEISSSQKSKSTSPANSDLFYELKVDGQYYPDQNPEKYIPVINKILNVNPEELVKIFPIQVTPDSKKNPKKKATILN